MKIKIIENKAPAHTGSEITCIWESFSETSREKLENCEMLPLVGTSIAAVTGIKIVNIKYQVYVELEIGDKFYYHTFFQYCKN